MDAVKKTCVSKGLIGKSLLKICAGIIGYIVAYQYMLQGGPPATGGLYYMAVIASPGVLVLVGIIELITGSEFGQLAHKWDSLPAHQKIILGTAVMVVSIVLLFVGVYLLG